MALTPYQASYNGLTIGDGTSYEIIKAIGLKGLPSIRTSDQPRSRDTGLWAGQRFYGGRVITVDVEVQGADDATFQTNMEAFAKAFATLSETPLAWNLPSNAQVRRSNVVVSGGDTPVDLNYRFRKALYMLKLDASDPRIYNDTLQSVATPVAVSSGGFSFPFSFPLTFGTSGASGAFNAVNLGNVETRPIVTIAGPVDNPTLENLTSSQHVTFSLTLSNTDTLTVDFGLHSVLLNGTAGRRGTMTSDSQWWVLAPGTSQVIYRANTVQTGSVATFNWRDAWIM